MSLSNEQKKELSKIGEQLRKIEKLAVENSLDLDVFMTEYNEKGFAVYATEKVSINPVAKKRKDVFQKETNPKAIKATSKSH